jgi:hypothetical protein
MLINIMGDSMTQCNSDASATQEERLLSHLLKGTPSHNEKGPSEGALDGYAG